MRPTRAAHYLRPGGPWDGLSLDALLTSRTSGEVELEVERVAGGLRSEGVKRGDAVAWQLRNVPEAIVLYRACWRLGAVAVPVHHAAGSTEAAAALAQVGPKLVITEPADVSSLIGLGRPVPAGAAPHRPPDLAAALFTSGATGTPQALLPTPPGPSDKGPPLRD